MNPLRAFVVSGLVVAALILTLSDASAIECRQTAVYDASTNGATKLVTGGAATRIFICGYTIFGAGTATVKLVTGTGTVCGTSEVALTPAYSLLAQTQVTDGASIWRGLFAAPGLDLCIKTSAGVAIQAIVYYAQQ